MKTFATAAFVLTLALSGAATAQRVQKSDDPRVTKLYALQPEQYVADEIAYSETWASLQEKDLQFKRRIWRTLDTRTDGNRHLLEAASSDATLASLFINDGLRGTIKIYAGIDQRFTSALKQDSLARLLSSEQKGIYEKFDPAASTRYMIKEDWLYSAELKQFVVRIIGIAPLRAVNRPGQAAKEEPVFWVYYPEARPQLRGHAIALKDDSDVQNLDEMFELRRFESTINAAGPFSEH
jgi:hypothetical protein